MYVAFVVCCLVLYAKATCTFCRGTNFETVVNDNKVSGLIHVYCVVDVLARKTTDRCRNRKKILRSKRP